VALERAKYTGGPEQISGGHAIANDGVLNATRSPHRGNRGSTEPLLAQPSERPHVEHGQSPTALGEARGELAEVTGERRRGLAKLDAGPPRNDTDTGMTSA
jgi:hypothetical protein